MENTKICAYCMIEKPIEQFSRNNASKDGLKSYCKKCASLKEAERRERNKENIRISARKSYWKSKENAEQKTKKELELKSKICNVCKIEKPITDFYKCGNGGFRSYCKKCANEKSRQYQQKNRDEIIARKRRYHKQHKEEIDAYNKQYYIDHSDEVKRRVNEWESNHPNQSKDNQVMYFHRARSKKAGITSTFTRKEWVLCKEHFSINGMICCAYCGKQISRATQDHIIPFEQGGENIKNNIVPSCISCNASKGTKNMHEWFTQQPFYSKEREDKIIAYINQ